MTEKTKFKLLAAFREMDKKIDMSTFENRLIFQKNVYLLQEFGLKLENPYGWYVRGPYSTTAASDGFQLEKIQDKVEDLPDISRDELELIRRFKQLLSESKDKFEDKSDDYFLELLASLHFIFKYGYPRPTSKEDALKTFLKKKPKFKEDDVGVALELLEKYGLINS